LRDVVLRTGQLEVLVVFELVIFELFVVIKFSSFKVEILILKLRVELE
jgi:hypothetical protein